MRNTWIFTWKEFLLNLRSARFAVGMLLCLVIVPFTMIVSVSDYRVQEEVCRSETRQARMAMNNCFVWSKVRPTIVREPETLSLFSQGITNNMGYIIPIQLGEIPFFPSQFNWVQNSPFMKVFASHDFSSILSIMVSLLALVFSYDAITREREEGTLRFIFSSSVSRESFLLGKWQGVVLTVFPIMLACFLLAWGFIYWGAGIRLSGSEWAGVGWMLLGSFVYLSAFAAFGILISSLTAKSVTSIVICMLSWLGFLFVIPALTSYLSRNMVALPAYKQVENQKNALYNSMSQEINAYWDALKDSMEMKDVRYLFNIEYEDGAKQIRGGSRSMLEHTRRMAVRGYEIRTDYAERMWKLDEEYLHKLSGQRKWQDALSLLSPSSTYQRFMSGLGNTDAASILAYMDSVRSYRQRFIAFMVDRDLFRSISYVTPCQEDEFMEDAEWDAFEERVRKLQEEDLLALEKIIIEIEEQYADKNYPFVDVREVPRFSVPELSGWERMRKGLPAFTFLFLFLIGCLGGAIYMFKRYDLR